MEALEALLWQKRGYAAGRAQARGGISALRFLGGFIISAYFLTYKMQIAIL